MSSYLRYVSEERKKSATLNLRIDPEIKAALERAAKAERRSVTNLIEKLIIDYVQKPKR